ncbi:MAG: GNAT family N-acetyltransferase [Magnetococcus sp. XQGC-1]
MDRTAVFQSLSSSCSLEPLSPRWQGEVKRLYDLLFAAADLPYGQRLPEDYLRHRLFASSLCSSDCSCMLVAPDGKGVGVLLANRRLNPASAEGEWLWLHLLAVAPDWQRQGLGRMLLHSLLERARREGKRGVATALQWSGIWPGVPAGLTTMEAFCAGTAARLRPGEMYLAKNLADPWPQAALDKACSLREEVTMRAYTDRHREGLQALLQELFSVGWQHETLSRIDPAYEPFNGYGLASTYDPVQPGRGVWVVTDRDRLVGFAVVQAGADGTAFFGPVGLRPEWRGQGLGSGLLLATARQAQLWGCHTLGLWTSVPLANGFYRSLGMQLVTTTRHGEWLS